VPAPGRLLLLKPAMLTLPALRLQLLQGFACLPILGLCQLHTILHAADVAACSGVQPTAQCVAAWHRQFCSNSSSTTG
jgi:hypothetical protein